ncbi:flagellar export chaperone FlgN [Duganella sp. Leaf126]|uniref:flagellar export chaperone FlgN n=1 Tax=Duganella sp. Leaf126 TaxID=1736266 RepID=UPI001E452AD5|nr:flagellar export chaperone FlgN [Duganella sp. Leaf126]
MTQQPASRQDAMRALLAGVADDRQAYAALTALLEEQFDAALRHQGPRLAAIAEHITALVAQADARRLQRVALAQQLNGPQATMSQAFALLKPSAREKMEADWRALEAQVIECKRLSKRNADLLVEQHGIMQRVLHGEDHIYEPI